MLVNLSLSDGTATDGADYDASTLKVFYGEPSNPQYLASDGKGNYIVPIGVTTLTVVVDSIDAVLFDGDGEKEVDTDITETSMETKRPVAPCPMHMSVQNIHLKQASDGTSISLASMNLWLNPRGENRTQVAVQFDDLNSHLLQLSKVNMCATLPPSPNVIESFSFAGERVVVSAGHSTDDWQRPARRIRTNITKSTPSVWLTLLR